MKALYDLRYELVTFDFYSWLVVAKFHGATEIVFDTSALAKKSIRRFESIIAPGPALVGLPCREGSDGERLPTFPQNKFKLNHLVAEARKCSLPRLRSIYE